MQQITTSEKQTYNFAKNFAKKLKGGKVIGLVGELGAGKTIFAKGLAAGLGIKKNITSPTFVLMKVYKIQKNKITNYKLPITSLVHIDAYRIKSSLDITAIGAQEYFNRPDTVVVIEWADRIKKILPKKTRLIKFKTIKSNERKIIF
jgi:tRNA threonylcarbamoyladenosine biosynthesis protein TsaE